MRHFCTFMFMNKLILFLLTTVMIACSEVSYNEPQPKGIKSLTEVPAKFHGTYFWQGETGDTVVFFKDGFRANNKKEEDVLYLNSDSLVLKKYKNYFFISYRDDHRWLLRILKPLKNGNFVYLEMENVPEDAAQRKIFIEKLSKESPVMEDTTGIATRYTIDPTPKKLYSLIQKGFFKEKSTLVKIK